MLYKYRERHKGYSLLSDTVKTVLITSLPDSSFHVLETRMKEQTSKAK